MGRPFPFAGGSENVAEAEERLLEPVVAPLALPVADAAADINAPPVRRQRKAIAGAEHE